MNFFLNPPGEMGSDFRIWKPCGSVETPSAIARVFWSCADEMILPLPKMAGSPECHGISPRILKVTTISALMAEVVKGNADPPIIDAMGLKRGQVPRRCENLFSECGESAGFLLDVHPISLRRK